MKESWHQIAADGELLTEVLYSLDGDGSLLFASSTLERVCGVPVAALREDSGSWLAQVVEDDRERVAAERQRRVREGTPGEVSYRVRNRINGVVSVLLDNGVAVHDEAGTVVRIDGVLRDISRHAARDTDGARQARMEAMGRMATSVAHSLNNILTVVSGYASALEGNPGLDPLEQRAIVQISAAAERASDVTRRLIGFALGKPPGVRPIHVVRFLKETRDLLRGMLSRAIELEVLAEPDLPQFRGDPLRLQEVMLHLADNARLAMDQGGKITLSARREDGRLLLEMRDTGTGMRREAVERAFDPFFTTRDQAAGLGCSYVQEIVEDHGGTVELHSILGEGTRVVIRLPLQG